MEHKIITDFQNLHMFAGCKFQLMDELVQDLTTALNETTKSGGGSGGCNSESKSTVLRKYNRKRRVRKRRTHLNAQQSGHVSEASESSIDEILKGCYEKVIWQSDSDDVFKQHSLPSGSVSGNRSMHTVPVLSLPESDSVNENFSPARMPRRKRRPKRMSIDQDSQIIDFNNCIKCPVIGDMCCHKKKDNILKKDGGTINDSLKNKSNEAKNSSKQCITISQSTFTTSTDTLQSAANMTNESSSLSSTDSDPNADDRDGDDEHSDFFHEPGSCTVAGVIPWWENSRLTGRELSESTDSKLDPLSLRRINQHSSKAHYQTRLRYLLSTREIRTAKKKLKGNTKHICQPVRRTRQRSRSNSVIASLDQTVDQTVWTVPIQHIPNTSEVKRRRKTPPLMDDLSIGSAMASPQDRLLFTQSWTHSMCVSGAISTSASHSSQPLTTSSLVNTTQPLAQALNQLQPINVSIQSDSGVPPPTTQSSL